MMHTSDGQIIDWAIQRIQTEYRTDISLLLGHGHTKRPRQKDTDHYKGEIDYFVPESDRAYAFSRSFIVDGIGYDLYPRSWENLEAMAALNDMHTSCLADAEILYARSEKDRKRFEEVRSTLLSNLKDARFVRRKAMDRLSVAKEIYQTMIFSQTKHEVRASAGFILDHLAQGIAFVNGSYFRQGSLYQLEEMGRFQAQPAAFAAGYNQVVFSADITEMKRLCYELINETQSFFQSGQSAETVVHRSDYRGLADWYQEMESIWRKIYSGCERQDAVRVFFWGCSLQHELDVIREEFGLQELDLLGAYDGHNLADMLARAKELKQYIVNIIIKNSAQVAIYSTVDDFLAQNS